MLTLLSIFTVIPGFPLKGNGGRGEEIFFISILHNSLTLCKFIESWLDSSLYEEQSKKSISLSKLKSFSESESGICTLSIAEHFLAAISDKKRAAKSEVWAAILRPFKYGNFLDN